MKTDVRDVTAAPAVYPLYADVIDGTPFCYDVSLAEFVDGATYSGTWTRKSLAHERIITVSEGGEIRGFAQVGVAPSKERGREDRGVIRFMLYPRGRRDVGRAVLRGVDAYARERDLRRVEAFIHGYTYRSYHLGFGALSATLGHVHGVLGANGYRVAHTEIFLRWDDYIVAPPALPDDSMDIAVTTTDEGGLLADFTVAVTHNGEPVCECINHSAGRYTRAPVAQATLFTAWLGVSDAWQGKGWGRYALTHALCVGRKLGYRNAAISADARNYRALLLYTNAGYSVADTAYSFKADA